MLGNADRIAAIAAILLAGCENPSGRGSPAWLEDAKKIAITEAIDLILKAGDRIVGPEAWTCPKCGGNFWVPPSTTPKACPICGAAWG